MCFGGSSSASAANRASNREQELYKMQLADQQAAAEAARREAAARQARITSGMANIDAGFKGFDDNYYGGLKQSYLDYYKPQLDDQYQKAQDTLLYNLARTGTLESSNRATGLADLEKAYGLQNQSMLANSDSYVGGAKSQVENNKLNQYSQLRATGGDAAQAAQFLNGPISVQAPTLSPMSPLGDLFTNLTGLVANDALIANANGGQGLLQSGLSGKKPTDGSALTDTNPNSKYIR